MDRQSDRLPRQTRCEGMRIKREIQMGASGGGQSIKAGGIAARTGRTQTCNRHDSPKPKTPLTRGGRPHNYPPADSVSLRVSPPFQERRGFSAIVAAARGGSVGRDAQSPATSRRGGVVSLSVDIPVPQCCRRRLARLAAPAANEVG